MALNLDHKVVIETLQAANGIAVHAMATDPELARKTLEAIQESEGPRKEMLHFAAVLLTIAPKAWDTEKHGPFDSATFTSCALAVMGCLTEEHLTKLYNDYVAACHRIIELHRITGLGAGNA